jgi:DeoR/GlpR family transcriptional regulator of sugar metabolism
LTFRATLGQDLRVLSSIRRTQLLIRLNEEGRASVDVLARDLGVTPSTIRRDLARLSADGAVVRTYGGAAVGPRTGGKDAPDPRLAAKRAIGAAAAALVDDGQTIVISSGTTALELARRLVDRRLTVITNALDVVGVLLDRPGIELVVLGGVVRHGMHSMLGHLPELALHELRADALFMGIGALSAEHGLMNDAIPEILTDRALRRASRACVVIADSSKLGAVAPAYVFGLEEVDTLVTDADADPGQVAAFETQGVRVILAASLEKSIATHDRERHPQGDRRAAGGGARP